jgi:hypothetical protein
MTPSSTRVAHAFLTRKAATLPLGQTVMTRGVHQKAQEDPSFGVFVHNCIRRHARGDWGEVKGQDKRMNDQALKSGEDRILSVYVAPDDTKIWIITEWDRSVTTVLFPDEY